MAEPQETAAQDLLPFHQKLAYGAGAFINNTLAAAIGGMMIVLNLGLGMNPALVGLLGALPRLFDAILDPVVGYMSDHTRSRWGRRRPFIFWGAITSGITYALLWQLPVERSETFVFWYFLIGSLLFYVAYGFFATPWVGLGYELTPDYHERTRLMGVQNFIGQLAYVVAPWFLWIMTYKPWFATQVEGAGVLAIGIGLQNFPEGFAVSMPLRRQGLSKFRSFWYGQLSAIVEPVFGVLGAVAVMHMQSFLPYALAFAAGAMIYVVVEEVIPESQLDRYTDISTLGFIGGFIVMMILDVALG